MTVTICGSMSNLPEMLRVYEELSLEGYLVYLPVILGVSGYERTVWMHADQQNPITPFPEIAFSVPRTANVDEGLKKKTSATPLQKDRGIGLYICCQPKASALHRGGDESGDQIRQRPSDTG